MADEFVQTTLADGTSDPTPESTSSVPDPTAQIATLAAEIESLKGQLAETATLKQKVAVLDKLSAALGSAPSDPQLNRYKSLYNEIKQVTQAGNPGLAALTEKLEADPHFFDKIQQGIQAVAGARLSDLNVQAQQQCEAALKEAFPGWNAERRTKMFATLAPAITQSVNGDPAKAKRFAAGDATVAVDELKGLIEPLLEARTQEKAERVAPFKPGAKPGPAAPPRGAAMPGSEPEGTKPFGTTPQARAAFHKATAAMALGRLRAVST